MTDLELFTWARPDVGPLDDAARAQLHRAVFAEMVADQQLRPAPAETIVTIRSVERERRWRRRRAVLPAAALLLVAAAALVISTLDATSRPSRVVPGTDTEPTTVSTDVATTPVPTTAIPPTAAAIDEWREHPQRRFSMPVEYLRPASDARELVIRRCMNASGFEYTLRPNFADIPSDGSGWPAGDQWDEWHKQQITTVRGFKAAYFGPSDEGGGCLDHAYATIYGPVRAEVYAENIRSFTQSRWIRTALADPGVLAALQSFAACARAHGVAVADPAVDAQKAQEDLAAFDLLLPQVDGQNSPSDYRAAVRAAADEICPSYGGYQDQLADATRLATVAWIEANPDKMTDIQREVDEDIGRFEWIIAHDGELPPN
jgi:hypothetical protein